MILPETHNVRMKLAEPGDVDLLLPDLRAADRREWLAFSQVPFRPALAYAIEHSLAFTALHKKSGKPLCIFGAAPDLDYEGDEDGIMWFAAANLGYMHIPSFMHLVPQMTAELHKRFPHLTAYAHADNAVHHHWLDATGWRLTGLVSVGQHPSHQFLRFERHA